MFVLVLRFGRIASCLFFSFIFLRILKVVVTVMIVFSELKISSDAVHIINIPTWKEAKESARERKINER